MCGRVARELRRRRRRVSVCRLPSATCSVQRSPPPPPLHPRHPPLPRCRLQTGRRAEGMTAVELTQLGLYFLSLECSEQPRFWLDFVPLPDVPSCPHDLFCS